MRHLQKQKIPYQRYHFQFQTLVQVAKPNKKAYFPKNFKTSVFHDIHLQSLNFHFSFKDLGKDCQHKHYHFALTVPRHFCQNIKKLKNYNFVGKITSYLTFCSKDQMFKTLTEEGFKRCCLNHKHSILYIGIKFYNFENQKLGKKILPHVYFYKPSQLFLLSTIEEYNQIKPGELVILNENLGWLVLKSENNPNLKKTHLNPFSKKRVYLFNGNNNGKKMRWKPCNNKKFKVVKF